MCAKNHEMLTLLVVEDHPATQAAMLDLLGASFDGARVLAVGSAEEGLALCATEAPHLVIMDIALPGMNGIEAVREIRGRFPGIGVVMHSSNDMPIYRDESLAAGAAAFVSKSATASELIPTISRLCV
jgi:DNA-binding NarL/FixJ family response regulator